MGVFNRRKLTRPTDETVADMVAFLTSHPEQVDWCIYMPRGGPRKFLDELWFESLGIWLRTDLVAFSGDLGRGAFFPTWGQRRRLRKALRAFLQSKPKPEK